MKEEAQFTSPNTFLDAFADGRTDLRNEDCISEICRHDGAPQRPMMTVEDFATLMGVEPASARAFCQKVDVAVQRAAVVLTPVVEQMAGRLIKLVERV